MDISPSTKSLIATKLAAYNSETGALNFTPVSGGCINNTFKISSGSRSFFCKTNSASIFPQLLQKERRGLEFIAKQNVIAVPTVIDSFTIEDEQVLLLEWMDEGERTQNFWVKFGEQLAALHYVTTNNFGWNEDNYMGSVSQSNKWCSHWIDFFINERIQPLFIQCMNKNLLQKKHIQQFENIFKKLPLLFNEDEKPALLHGDLWSGNFMCNKKSEPVLIDPAVYFGHPAMDLAMTDLFGGFKKEFYESYHYHFPFPKDHKKQWMVCNLYPLLIHLLLFGTSYLPQIENILQIFH